jgi:putative PIN family toxin of toxin-antitoxin system
VIRAVLDTNLLVSYLLAHRAPIATIIDDFLAQDQFIMISAPELLVELDRVLTYPKLQRHYSDEERRCFVALVFALSEAVDLPETVPRICRDPDDDRRVACAVVGGADVIVSGDEDVLALQRVGDIPILTAAQFLKVLEQGN